MSQAPRRPTETASQSPASASTRPTSPNVIVLNEEGLDDSSLARVLSPFSNSRRFVGICVAAEAETRILSDDLLDKELTAFARASAAQD